MRLAPFKSFGRLYILIYFLTFLKPVYSQSELPIDEDPYLDPDGIKALSSNQGFSENQGILIGILYGLHPALVFSPALSLGYYNEPFAVGVEISDSDKLEFWSKQKKNGHSFFVLTRIQVCPNLRFQHLQRKVHCNNQDLEQEKRQVRGEDHTKCLLIYPDFH